MPGSNAATGPASYYLSDHLGSVREQLTQGKIATAKFEFLPYGEMRPGFQMGLPNRGFTGHQADYAAGVYFAAFRYYSVTTSRWLSRDPLGFVDGMNLYGYVSGMPTIHWDSDGRSIDWSDWGDRFANFGMCMLGLDDLPDEEPVPRPLNNPYFEVGLGMVLASKIDATRAIEKTKVLWQPIAKRITKRYGMKFAGKALAAAVPGVGWYILAVTTTYEVAVCGKKKGSLWG